MPLYDYLCPSCGAFSAWGSIKDPRADAPCPSCKSPGTRTISAPSLRLLSDGERRARDRNEKSAHEPAHQRRSGCGCAGAHTCGGASKASPAKTRSDTQAPGRYSQTGPGARPWMLGH